MSNPGKEFPRSLGNGLSRAYKVMARRAWSSKFRGKAPTAPVTLGILDQLPNANDHKIQAWTAYYYHAAIPVV